MKNPLPTRTLPERTAIRAGMALYRRIIAGIMRGVSSKAEILLRSTARASSHSVEEQPLCHDGFQQLR